jgi:uncharacterized repeat protein (TIGR03806 family)
VSPPATRAGLPRPGSATLAALGIAALAALCTPSCSSKDSDPAAAAPPAAPGTCTPGGDGAYLDELYPKLSTFCMVKIADGEVVPEPGVLPYDLNAPLFSDYAAKRRTVWLPPGTSVTYAADGRFVFPVGTIITKSFGFAADLRAPDQNIRWVETRVMALASKGWLASSYAWDADQREATVRPGGRIVDAAWIDSEGNQVATKYLIPQANQCIKCHADLETVVTIGPTARQLNRDYAYPDGAENQLARWSKLGLLTGAPTPDQAPRLTAWPDTSAPLESRARAYMEANCAHCHNETGDARTSGLILLAAETDPGKLGVCKSPVAAGKATSDLLYDVFPGKPDQSILIRRLASTAPQISMPELGRSVVHAEGLALLRAWIEGLDGQCGK